MKRGVSSRTKIVALSIAALVLLGGAIAAIYFARQQSPSITTYQQCVDNGYPVSTANPPICTGPNGQKFTGPRMNEDDTNQETRGQIETTPTARPFHTEIPIVKHVNSRCISREFQKAYMTSPTPKPSHAVAIAKIWERIQLSNSSQAPPIANGHKDCFRHLKANYKESQTVVTEISL